MPRQRKWAQREHPNERFRKGAGGGRKPVLTSFFLSCMKITE
jgi:hypothetical protein